MSAGSSSGSTRFSISSTAGDRSESLSSAGLPNSASLQERADLLALSLIANHHQLDYRGRGPTYLPATSPLKIISVRDSRQGSGVCDVALDGAAVLVRSRWLSSCCRRRLGGRWSGPRRTGSQLRRGVFAAVQQFEQARLPARVELGLLAPAGDPLAFATPRIRNRMRSASSGHFSPDKWDGACAARPHPR